MSVRTGAKGGIGAGEGMGTGRGADTGARAGVATVGVVTTGFTGCVFEGSLAIKLALVGSVVVEVEFGASSDADVALGGSLVTVVAKSIKILRNHTPIN